MSSIATTENGGGDWKLSKIHPEKNFAIYKESLLTYPARRYVHSDMSNNMQLEEVREKITRGDLESYRYATSGDSQVRTGFCMYMYEQR